MSVLQKKTIVVGDGVCGKTCLLTVFTTGKFPEEYVPTVFENNSVTINLNNRIVQMDLWDTAGQEDYDRVRRLFYNNTDVVILCFSVDNRTSFANVKAKWAPDLNKFCQKSKIVLVANKIDLRAKGVDTVNTEEGNLMAKKIKADCYLECSALEKIGINEVFETAAALAAPPLKEHKKCNII